MIDFLKDKIYYIMGATLLLIILILLLSCSSDSVGGSYEAIEEKMVSAAKEYFKERKKILPKEEGEIVKVSINTLVEAELLSEVKDPKNSKSCSGYVEVYKVDSDYAYIPFLTCTGNYEPNYLNEKIKADTPDELGDGVYEIDGEYRYRGENVKNYVSFNNSLWRIIKVDQDGDIKIIKLDDDYEETYAWDDTYNAKEEADTGLNTDFNTSNVRRILKKYQDNLSKEAKTRLVKKTICVGAYSSNDTIEKSKDCEYKVENQYFVMLTMLDVKYATTNEKCEKVSSLECNNRNYLIQDNINGWIGAVDTETNFDTYFFSYGISKTMASYYQKVPYVVYLTGKTLTNSGNGTKEKPYLLK